ncbi:TPA: hypothetical protein N0F65_004815 [Lagenidium giganteum]|uniref:Transmembrane protein n=1 Tax=Lagenidium giganteum TaxID=4803 RepID=A0AAV2ZC49_9STRA|nr:TPA: hypothetical protein N0F65_004815 [Lagenidium giganteum]
MLAICYHKSGVRPFFCDDIWINYRGSCRSLTSETYPQVGVIWVDTFRRLMQLQLRFPDKRVDLTLLSSHEDVQHNVEGLSYMSRRKVDVATVIRVRDCVEGGDKDDDVVCKTIFIDDSRYENAVLATSAAEWYTILVAIRVFAQSYFYLRIVMLLYGCYRKRSEDDIYRERSVVRSQWFAAHWRTFFFCLFVIVLVILGAVHVCLEVSGYYGNERHSKVELFTTRSAVPYSAGSLWPATAVSVSWTNDVISDQLPNAAPTKAVLRSFFRRRNVVVRPAGHVELTNSPSTASIRRRAALVDWPASRRKQTKFLLHQMEHIHERRAEVDTITVLLNLVNMTDPWTYFRLRYLHGEMIYYFECATTKRVFMLPEAMLFKCHDMDLPLDDMTFLLAINSRELAWSDLIQSG